MKQALIVLLAAGIIVGGFSLMGPLGTKDKEPELPAADDGGEIRILESGPAARILLEQEADARVEPPVRVVMDVPGASGGRCFYLGPEKVNELPETRQYQKGYPEATHPGFARWSFRSPQTANYRIWVRVRWSDDCGDSLDVAVNGAFIGTVQGNADPDEPRWIWLSLGSRNLPLTVHLPADKEHTLTLANREDDLHFDQVLLVEESSPFEPVGVQKP